MGNTDRRGPEISDGWQGTSDDGVDSNFGSPIKVAVIGAGVAGLGETSRLRDMWYGLVVVSCSERYF